LLERADARFNAYCHLEKTKGIGNEKLDFPRTLAAYKPEFAVPQQEQ